MTQTRPGTVQRADSPVGPAFSPRVGLAVAVLAISCASLLIRWASAPPLVVGTYRLAFATALFWAAAAVTHTPLGAGWTARRLATAGAAAACLAAHFGLWIASLSLTSVASSVLLVSTQPLFVAVLGRGLLGERVAPRAAFGIALALLGTAAITGGNLRSPAEAWRGDLLALGGALAMALHYLLLRRLRPHVGLLSLMAVETPIAAVLLGLAARAAGEPLGGLPTRTYGLCFLLALIPTGIGHTLLNWALRYMKAYEVNVVVLGEPIGATVLALLFLGERPPLHVLAGGAVVLGGILLAWSASRPSGTVVPLAS